MLLNYYFWNQTQGDKIAAPQAAPMPTPADPHAADHTSPRILLLHGLGGTGNLWRPIAAGIEKEMHVLALDQRGHGGSSNATGGFSPKDYGQDVIDTLGQLHFHPCWGIGHSMGVRTAVAAAHLRPDFFNGLILVDLALSGLAGGGVGETLSTFLKDLPSRFPSRALAREFLTRECPDPSIAQYLLAVSVTKPDKTVEFPFNQNSLLKTLDEARNFSIKPWLKDLAELGKPIYLLRGEKSPVWKREDFEKEKQAHAKYTNLHFIEVANAGHGLPFEQKTAFLNLVREAVR